MANNGVGDTPLGTDTAPSIVFVPNMGPGGVLSPLEADTTCGKVVEFTWQICVGTVAVEVVCHPGNAFCHNLSVLWVLNVDSETK